MPGAPKSDARVEGTAFGKYHLFASLGRGGMADVYLSVARGPMGFNKLAVVKRLRPALAEEAGFRTMFLDEARLAARLNHPNIVHTYEVGEQDGVYFIAMEYLEGQPLNKVIKEMLHRKVQLDASYAVRIVADALAGLNYAHELKDYDGRPLEIVHRDVSPHNVFVTYDGHTKLVDFGIAKAATSSTATEVGVLKGKVAYMSPEQAMGNRLDGRSDLFAMGVVLWELLAQQRLFPGEFAANTIHKLMNEPIPRISTVRKVDAMLDDLVARALEKTPEKRWQSAAEMRAALETWLGRQRSPARQEDVAEQMNNMFASVKAEVQRQVQKHMAQITPAEDTQELRTLNEAALKHHGAGGTGSAHLLKLGLGGSGSGSGVLTSHGNHAASVPPTGPVRTQPRSNALAIVIALGCIFLAALAILVLGRRGTSPAPTVATTEPPAASSVLGAATTPPAVATSTSSGAVANAPPVEASGSASAKHHPQPPPPPVPAPAAHPVTPAQPAMDPGFLTVSSYPWAKVTEGGRVVCPVTPCNKVSMPAGAHALTFENGVDPLQKQTVTVTVKSGETATKNVGFK